MARFLTFIASFNLVFGSLSGACLAWMLLQHPQPWELDLKGNAAFFGITEEDFLNLFSTYTGLASYTRMHYELSAYCLILASVLILLISFFAPRNRTLQLCTQVVYLVWLLVMGYKMQHLNTDSIHTKAFFSSLFLAIIGTTLYTMYLLLNLSKSVEPQKDKDA
mmetsp:Transcript_14262/g.21564  ORF Transcript_14262/g.21564 Transcript_14262/m.21564 type:complete len:164 (-) Transcript_14262:741-1232(-)